MQRRPARRVGQAPPPHAPSFLLLALSSLTLLARAADPPIDPKDLPRRPPVEPADVLKTLQIKKGFRIEPVATEPLVVDPVALSFDENGRLFVVEMRDYSERRDEKLSRIRMLVDDDGDGKFDRATIFAQDLPWATALIWYGGGLFVAATPDIYFFKDTNNDGVADEKKTVFTGFASGVDRLNMQALVNSFHWGLDNRIHGAASFNAGVITSPLNPSLKPVDLRGGKGFSFDPRTFDLRPENGGGQHGMSFDDYGRRYVCSNSDHLQTFIYDSRYAGRNPHYVMPDPRVSIAADGPAAEVFRISPEEPWRIVRTRWRIAGLVTGPVEGGGRSAGYFTGATGATIYRGDAYGPDFVGNAFIGDAGGNLVHRKVIRRKSTDSLEPVAERPADEKKIEFLASTDTWFRPVQFANAPDGCLYVLDMYRETIEHPWSIPPSIKQHLDLNSGNDRGRIYRIVPDGFQPRPTPRLGAATTDDLVQTLEHPNGWHRDTAARLLFERQDLAAAPALHKMAGDSRFRLARLHALYALAGLNQLTARNLQIASRDDPRTAIHALRLSETITDPAAAPHLQRLVQELCTDHSIDVRHQAALTLSRTSRSDRTPLLLDVLRPSPADGWIHAAVLNAVTQSSELFERILADESLRSAAVPLLEQLATLIGAANEPQRVREVLQSLASLPDPASRFALARSLGQGQRRAGRSLTDLGADAESLVASAASVAVDTNAPENQRLQATRLLGELPFNRSGQTLLSLLSRGHPQSIQLAALRALDESGDALPVEKLAALWTDFPPRLKSEAITILLKRPRRAIALLNAIEAGQVPHADLSTTQTRALLVSAHDDVKILARKVLKTSMKSREEVLDQFLPALNLKGDPERGKTLFTERCISCHRLDGQGHALGPDLVSVKTTGREKMLASILDPNREVQPNYLAFEVETKDGDSHLGIVHSDTEAALTLRQAFGNEVVIPRANIKRMRSQAQSLMPENLEENLTPQHLADLLEYISTASP